MLSWQTVVLSLGAAMLTAVVDAVVVARQDAQHLVGELSPLVGTISLLFGMLTTVEQEASAAVHGLERARDLLAEEDPAGWQAAMDESLGRRAKFEEAARKAVGA